MNKHFYSLLLACIIAMQTYAQIIDTNWGTTLYDSSDYQFEAKWKRLYEHLDLTDATTGFLINRAVNFIDPQKHIGNLSLDDESGFEAMRSLHTALQMAEVADNGVLKDSTEILDTLAGSYGDNAFPISVFRVNYNYIRPDAFDQGRLEFDPSDTTIRMGSNTVLSPYIQGALFIAAPCKHKLDQGVYSFILPSALFITNTGTTIDSARLKFGNMDTGFRILPDVPVSINLTQLTGETFLEIRVYFSDDKSFYAKAPVEFFAKTVSDIYTTVFNVINVGATVNHAGAKVSIALGCGKTELVKPLIITEGFDPDQKFNYDDFIKQLLLGGAEIREILLDLETQGYDLVYIDYNDGGDYIERNTNLFKDVVNQINTLKHANGSTEPNAVLGVSLGAVIARLGLRQMEVAGQDHETDLYMSLDGPHTGAYMPHSLVTMLAHFENLAERRVPVFDMRWFSMPKEAALAIKKLRTPAARQLLTGNLLDDAPADFQNNANGVVTGKMNRDFFAMYSAIGSLEHCREVAITNGSIVQKDQQYPASGGYAFLPGNAELASITGNRNMIFFYDFSASFTLKGLPDKQAGVQYYKGRIDAAIAVGLSVVIRFNLTNYDLETVADNTLSYDNSPGGYLDITEFGDFANVGAAMGASVSVNVDKFCFVPTASSLGFQTDNLRYDFEGNSTSTPIPFGSGTYDYYTPGFASPLFKQYSSPSTNAAVANYWNEAHSIPSAQSGLALGYELLAPAAGLPAIIDEIIDLAGYLTGLPLDQYLNALPYLALNYGYKRTTDTDSILFTSGSNIHRSLTFPAYVKLNINTDFYVFSPTFNDQPSYSTMPVSFDPGRYFISDSNSSFWVSTAGGGCGTSPITIVLEDESEVVLGSPLTNKSGVLNINNDATVKFEDGSGLKLYNQSRIIVRSGSTLEVEDNVDIELNGNDCVIEFEPGSNLVMPGAAVFSFTGNGFIRILGGSAFSGVNIDGRVRLTGSGKSDRVLELKKASVSLNNVNLPATADLIEIIDGRVESDCVLNADGPMAFEDSHVQSGVYYFNNELESSNTDWVAYLNCFDQTSILGGDITGEVTATNINNGTDKLEVNGTVFNGLESQGLKVYNSRTDIRNTAFLSNDYALQFNAMTYPATLTGVTVNNSGTIGMPGSGGRGVKFSAASVSSLHLEGCNILGQKTSGVLAQNAVVSMECTSVKTTSYYGGAVAVYLGEGSSLILDPSIAASGGGKVDLSGYHNTIYAYYAEDIQIDNGKANLSSSIDAFGGLLTKNYSVGVNLFRARQNYWKWGGAPDRVNHYYDFDYLVPVLGPKQFGLPGNGTITATGYLTSPPNLLSLCSHDDGGGGATKTGTYLMDNHTILSAGHIPFDQKLSLKDAASSVFAPAFRAERTETKLRMCADIITHNYFYGNDDPQPVIDMVYQKMLVTFGQEMDKGNIPNNGSSQAAEMLMRTQEHLLAQTSLSDDRRYKLMMDKMFNLRLQGRHSDALHLLDQIKTGYYSKHKMFIDKWECQLTNEKLLADKAITNKQFLALVNECGTQEKDIILTPFDQYHHQEKTTGAGTSLKEDISVYPNPAVSILNITWSADISVAEIVVMTLEGKEVLHQEVGTAGTVHTATIDLERLVPGVYVVHFNADRHIDPKKLTIVK